MARKVKWAEIAWKDLEKAADYIAKDSPYYAAAFVRSAQDAARFIWCAIADEFRNFCLYPGQELDLNLSEVYSLLTNS